MIQAKLNVQTVKNGKKVYSVEVGDLKYKSSPTHREYQAMYLTIHPDWGLKNRTGEVKEIMSATYRFGRLDLVGKGDSRHFDTSSDKKVFATVFEPC